MGVVRGEGEGEGKGEGGGREQQCAGCRWSQPRFLPSPPFPADQQSDLSHLSVRLDREGAGETGPSGMLDGGGGPWTGAWRGEGGGAMERGSVDEGQGSGLWGSSGGSGSRGSRRRRGRWRGVHLVWFSRRRSSPSPSPPRACGKAIPSEQTQQLRGPTYTEPQSTPRLTPISVRMERIAGLRK